jgi:hypothetical protein
MNTGLELDCIDAARKLSHLFINATPPFSVDPLAKHFGVSEVRERPLDRDACLTRESGRLVIEVNSLFPRVRQRLSVAHEIGHLIVDYCSPDRGSHWGHYDSEVESLCNRLAGQLLAPDWALRRHFEQDCGLADWRHSIRCSTILAAASKFGISVDAAASRIFSELDLAPGVAAIIWRHAGNTVKPTSEKDLRISSAWHSLQGSVYIPRNKTAPVGSVIRKASKESGVFSAVEDLTFGKLRGRFQVDASGFGPNSDRSALCGSRSVLSLVSPHSYGPPSTTT